MLNNRRAVLLSLLLLTSLMVSCASTSGTTKTASETKYPSWYNTSRSVQSDDLAYFGYATALASDSVRSSKKAVTQAKAELKSAISNRLELIRNKAVVELGSNSGLGSPEFIIALRNAESKVPAVADVVEMEVEKNGKKRFRSFSKVSADRKILIKELDKALSAKRNVWNAMKKSHAFSNF